MRSTVRLKSIIITALTLTACSAEGPLGVPSMSHRSYSSTNGGDSPRAQKITVEGLRSYAGFGKAVAVSGNVAMIYNHYSANDDPNITLWPTPRHRYPTRVAISEDGGYTWPYMRDIDRSDGFSGEENKALNRRCDYPCIIQTRDGAIHVAYSYRDRQCIKYVRFREEWIRGQLDYVVED